MLTSMWKPTTVFALLATLAGCGGSELTAPAVEPPSAPRLNASGETINERITPFTYTWVNPCNGQLVTLVGSSHVVTRNGTSASGGLFTHVHSNIQGRGTDVLGNSYVGKDERDEIMNATDPAGDGTFTTTVQQSMALLATRPTGALLPDDYRLHTLIHLTVNSNGEIKALTIKATPEQTCR